MLYSQLSFFILKRQWCQDDICCTSIVGANRMITVCIYKKNLPGQDSRNSNVNLS